MLLIIFTLTNKKQHTKLNKLKNNKLSEHKKPYKICANYILQQKQAD